MATTMTQVVQEIKGAEDKAKAIVEEAEEEAQAIREKIPSASSALKTRKVS